MHSKFHLSIERLINHTEDGGHSPPYSCYFKRDIIFITNSETYHIGKGIKLRINPVIPRALLFSKRRQNIDKRRTAKKEKKIIAPIPITQKPAKRCLGVSS
jgi:hypothetical protein